ncbi:MAG: ABC transporter substrate-binding protein [Deltaproteobacteria bacterium]|nr:ABC transporter substrate-binding protein [Candidatus Anaeroferrophillacea bacterium]
MFWKRLIAWLPAIVALLLPAVINSPPAAAATVVTDLQGREVAVQVPAKSVVALRAALGLVCYLDLADRVVGVEELENRETEWVGSVGRSYRMANPRLGGLPVIGSRNRPDVERLMAAAPDVIFTAAGDPRFADNLQRKTGIPVLFVDNGDLAGRRAAFEKSLRLIGTICGAEARAAAVIDRVEAAVADLRRRTADIPAGKRPSTYIGGMNFRVAHGLLGTSRCYPPFVLLGADNVADRLTVDRGAVKGRFSLDLETLLAVDPEIIFVCESGLELVRRDLHRPALRELRAVRAGNLYGVLPHYYAASPDTVLAETYFMGKILYPERFADLDIAAVADDFYRFFVGRPLYAEMTKIFGGFTRLETGP